MDTTSVLVLALDDPGTKSELKVFVSPHIIEAKNFVQEVVALHRISTSIVKLNLYHRGWVETIEILHI